MIDFIPTNIAFEEEEEEEDEVVIEDASTENIPASEGGETTTAEEVAKITGKPVVAASEDDDESEEEDDDEEDESTDDDENAEDDESDEENDDESGDDEDVVEVEDEAAEDDESEELAADDDQTFELKVEDANGKEFVLKPGDDIEKALDEFEPKSNGQIMKVLYDFQKLESEKLQYDENKETANAEAEHKATLDKINTGWKSEIKELQGQKRLPVQTDGKQSDREKEVFKFMAEENDKREAKDRPLIRSFEDALDKLELREHKEAEAKKAKEEKDTARKKGSIVGGSSAPASSGAPVYKGGARNAVEAARMTGLLK